MTKAQMQDAFRIELDKVDSLQYPAFTDDELDYLFDRAQDQFIETRYSGSNPSGFGFEENQKRLDDLRYLVVEDILTTTLDNGTLSSKPNCYTADLTDLADENAYRRLVGEECTITYTDRLTNQSVNLIQPITECTANNYVSQVHDPLSSHRLHYNTASPLRLIKGDTIELITDGTYAIYNYIIRYIKNPTSFVTLESTESPDFPVHAHPEIVKIAVNIAIENIESPRSQSYPIKVAEME